MGQPTVLDESNIVAFISLNQNISPEPVIKEDGRISFKFSEDVSDSIREFYEGKEVSIKEFVQSLRTIRSMIFTLRNRR